MYILKFTFYSFASLLWLACGSIKWVSSFVVYIELMWSYGSSKRTDFTLVLWWSILALGGGDIELSTFLLESFGIDPFLLMLWRSCYIDAFFLIKNGSLIGNVSNFTSCHINISFASWLLSIHLHQSSFIYVIEEGLGIWKNLEWYCWPEILWTWWNWFGPFWQ